MRQWQSATVDVQRGTEMVFGSSLHCVELSSTRQLLLGGEYFA